MARPRMPGEKVYQWFTAEWRRKALKILAATNGTTMADELDAAADARLTAAGIPLRNGQDSEATS